MAHYLAVNIDIVYTVQSHFVPCCHLVVVAMGKPLLFAQRKEWSVVVSWGIAFSGTK